MDRQTESGMDKQADTKKDRKTNGRTRTEWTTDGRTQKYILGRIKEEQSLRFCC